MEDLWSFKTYALAMLVAWTCAFLAIPTLRLHEDPEQAGLLVIFYTTYLFIGSTYLFLHARARKDKLTWDLAEGMAAKSGLPLEDAFQLLKFMRDNPKHPFWQLEDPVMVAWDADHTRVVDILPADERAK